MSLDQLLHDLDQELCTDPKGPRVASILANYADTSADWREFARFETDRYTRHLLGATERFELLLICWDAGQVSPVHNHEGQRCWMGVIEGCLAEEHFAMPDPGHRGPLDVGHRREFEQGKVAYISDEIALHRISTAPSTRSVSLHLYALPIRECNLYCDRTGNIERRRLAYDSVRGVPSGSSVPTSD